MSNSRISEAPNGIAAPQLSVGQQDALLRTVGRSIKFGLLHGVALRPQFSGSTGYLREQRASFVTLKVGGLLRGCIGTVEASLPLVQDVAHNAFAAAFRDRRFVPLVDYELTALDAHVSVLSDFETIDFLDENDLLRQLRPFVDGLLVADATHCGVFLPTVWEHYPRRKQFLDKLCIKSGILPDTWPDDVQVERFTTQSFGGAVGEYLNRRSKDAVVSDDL